MKDSSGRELADQGDIFRRRPHISGGHLHIVTKIQNRDARHKANAEDPERQNGKNTPPQAVRYRREQCQRTIGGEQGERHPDNVQQITGSADGIEPGNQPLGEGEEARDVNSRPRNRDAQSFGTII